MDILASLLMFLTFWVVLGCFSIFLPDVRTHEGKSVITMRGMTAIDLLLVPLCGGLMLLAGSIVILIAYIEAFIAYRRWIRQYPYANHITYASWLRRNQDGDKPYA